MKTSITCAALLVAILNVGTHSIADTFGTGANEFTIDFVRIGNPGNAADTRGSESFGPVPYVYRIGKYEISREMVEKANAEGNLGLTLESMDFVTGVLGDGPRPAMPATGIYWIEAVKFVNWLNTSQGFQQAYKVSSVSPPPIELWQSGDAGYNAANPLRNSLARYFLPSVDEWHKAAYYDPNYNGGTGGYWHFPTGSDTPPTAVSGGTAPGTAVYFQPGVQGPADTNSAGGLSPYGVMGLGGNVWEWEETEFDLLNDNSSFSRGIRGGAWAHLFNFDDLVSGRRYGINPQEEFNVGMGFRVASVPEPSTRLLAALGMLALLQRRGRSR